MSGPAPKSDAERRRRNAPARGEWTAAPGEGWQHGPVPKPPSGLVKASKDAWETWFAAWFAAHWSPSDLPGLRQLVRLYDQVERDPSVASLQSQLRQMMDIYGVTPKGQQDRRWKRPEGLVETEVPASSGKYSHLRAVGD